MRLVILLLFLSLTCTAYAEDPLESLNTVEDTVTTMHHTLRSRGTSNDKGAPGSETASTGENSADEQLLYFVSDEPLGAPGWVMVTPCSAEGVPVADEASGACGSVPEEKFDSTHLWKSRPAVAADLLPGVMVIARDKARLGDWYLARITDVSDLGSGYVSISAPFKAQLKNLRVVEE